MTSLERQCGSVFCIVADSILDDEYWRAFGYNRRPRRGKIFEVFVPEDKLERETVFLKELWAATFARVFYWASKKSQFKHRVDFIARLMELCIDGIDEPLWPSLRFSNAIDAIEFLKKACKEYSRKDINSHHEIFINRCIAHLNQDLPKIWLFGVSWLFYASKFANIIIALNISKIAENPNSDIIIREEYYRNVVRKMLVKRGKKDRIITLNSNDRRF